MMEMQRYDFELVYTPGKHLVLADTLSRAPADSCLSATDEDTERHLNVVLVCQCWFVSMTQQQDK